MDKKVDLVMGDKTIVKGVNCWLDRNTVERNTYSINQKQIQPKKLIIHFRDGTEATYSLEENDGSLQKFLDRVQDYHELEKEHECLKKQLKEANEVIKGYDSYTYALEPDGKVVCREANNAHFYLEKWGVK